jgi:hypothetical protein
LWQLKLSIEKCYVLNIGKVATDCNYSVSGHVLPVVTSCRDLGIMVSSDLKPRTHINTIVLKAKQRANIILRCFISRDVSVLLRAFKVYVRPILECNSVVWSPTLKCDIDCIENVQRSFTKRLPGLKNVSYEERLNRLNITSLELRRLHADLIMCFKIVFRIVDVDFDDFFKYSPATVTRGHRYKLFVQRSSGTRTTFFSERVVSVWNSLPPSVVKFSSLCSFKRSIKSVDFNNFLLLTLQ